MNRFAIRVFVGLFLMSLLLSTLAGCMRKTGDPAGEIEAANPTLYIDRETGCEYLSTINVYHLTPRIAKDGKSHMGCGVKP